MEIAVRVGIVIVTTMLPGCSECFDHRARERSYLAGQAKAEEENRRDFDRAYQEVQGLTFEDGFEEGHALTYDGGYRDGYFDGYQAGQASAHPGSDPPAPLCSRVPEAAPREPDAAALRDASDEAESGDLRTDDHREAIEACSDMGYVDTRDEAEALAAGHDAGSRDNEAYADGVYFGLFAGYDAGQLDGWDAGFSDGLEAADAAGLEPCRT